MYTTLCISSLLRNETFCCCSTLWFSCLKLWFCIFSDQVYPTNYCAQMRPFYLIEAIQTNRMELNEQGEIFAVECIWTKLSSSILDAYLMQSTSISHFSLHAFFWKKKKTFLFLTRIARFPYEMIFINFFNQPQFEANSKWSLREWKKEILRFCCTQFSRRLGTASETCSFTIWINPLHSLQVESNNNNNK